MRIIYSLLFLLIFLLGAFLGIKAYGLSKAIFGGAKRGVSDAIIDSGLYGLSLSLVIFGGVYLFASISDNTYPIEISLLLKTFALFFIPGILVFIGSLMQYFVFGLYRDRLMKFILRKRNDKKIK